MLTNHRILTFSWLYNILSLQYHLGLRYHTEWGYRTTFNDKIVSKDTYIDFPAVTICPLTSDLPALTNPRLLWGNFTNGFSESVTEKYTTTLVYRGRTLTCTQLNNQPGVFEEARGPHYALIIRASQDPDASAASTSWNQSSPYPLTGILGVVHVHGQEPELDNGAIFYAPLGESVQVSVSKYIQLNYGGRELRSYFQAIPSPVSNFGFPNTSQMILSYNQYGIYYVKPYHVYRAWDWIGEVGGAAALLYFLQHAILWASIGCARRTCYREAHRERKRAELEEREARAQLAAARSAEAAAAAEVAAAPPAPSNTAASSASPTRKKRKPRAQQSDTDIEMGKAPITRTQPAPRTDGRVAIDMDSLAEDSESY